MPRSRSRKQSKRTRRSSKRSPSRFVTFISLAAIAAGLAILYSLPRPQRQIKPPADVSSKPMKHPISRMVAVPPVTTPSAPLVHSPEHKPEPAPIKIASPEPVAKTVVSVVASAPGPKSERVSVANVKTQPKIENTAVAALPKTEAQKKTTVVVPKKEPQPAATVSVPAKQKLQEQAAAEVEKPIEKEQPKQVVSTKDIPGQRVLKPLAVEQKELKSSVKPVEAESKPKEIVFVQKPTVETKEVKLAMALPPKKSTLPEAKAKVAVCPAPVARQEAVAAKPTCNFFPSIFRPKKPKGVIAIVLDDWGYSLTMLNMLREIRQPLTIAVLPNLPYSLRIAREAKLRHMEIILHLPMEPHPNSGVGLEEDTITVDMTDAAIDAVMGKQLKRVPYASGINNHMGSQATEDCRVMAEIFKYLKSKNLYFLDSLVTSDSVCSRVAEQTNIRFSKRDVFLDNEEDPVYIVGQIEELKELAKANGKAVGIGHARPQTLMVLQKELPRLQKEGYKFVTVSELLK